MTWFRYIAMIMLSLSIALAGFPVQAKPECPMAAKMQMQQTDMKDCKGCDSMAKQESEKSGCCDESGCNAKCPAMSSGGVTMNLLTIKADLPAIGEQASRFYPTDAAVASAHLASQERPPKSLS